MKLLEFSEKLQQLRKQSGYTQEQLAEKLYVSRTAVSKWESGKGYPNIESLKCISELFSVTIDELLSGEELIVLAEKENSSRLRQVYSYIASALDLSALLFIFLPLYANLEVSNLYSVNLLSFNNTTAFNITVYWCVFISLTLLGIAEIALTRFGKEASRNFVLRCSSAIDVFAICFFAAAREPYANAFLFLIFLIKLIILLKRPKQANTSHNI